MSDRSRSVLDFYDAHVFEVPEEFFRTEDEVPAEPRRPSTRTRTRISSIPPRIVASAALAVATTFLWFGGGISAGSRADVCMEQDARPSVRVPSLNARQLRNAEMVTKLFAPVPPDDGDDPDYGF
jgi:hypothetical protein